ncbi:MAG: NUDIX hydrolase [Phenylobacterium sp.]|jgi:8-oxo-dGTP pyrophosphatase MutT (NUDIX family)|uniref:NUDIX hydrolase n=1 Tax=Phenylobacterium sp. TaxID=1871053 RepID=UPI002A2A2BE4|nr:NUDIX hydrolase [Phenylobacterium sp.]MDD3837362.1 NUDIX hydrolase [Phenylobacterium sp.]MDX9998920.1 NUDIX hydrolase [Phenylobacterium sp.]
MPKVRKGPLTQYAALPWRRDADGRIEILLITSRETRRWVIPKGWPITGLSGSETAAQEAIEEAGVTGDVWTEPVGGYDYDKRLKSRALQPVEVEVFPLAVREEHATWPEKGQRERRWFPAAEAAGLVAEPRLAELMREFGGRG